MNPVPWSTSKVEPVGRGRTSFSIPSSTWVVLWWGRCWNKALMESSSTKDIDMNGNQPRSWQAWILSQAGKASASLRNLPPEILTLVSWVKSSERKMDANLTQTCIPCRSKICSLVFFYLCDSRAWRRFERYHLVIRNIFWAQNLSDLLIAHFSVSAAVDRWNHNLFAKKKTFPIKENCWHVQVTPNNGEMSSKKWFVWAEGQLKRQILIWSAFQFSNPKVVLQLMGCCKS